MTSARARSSAPLRRVLVVEDEIMIRMLLEDMLGDLGYDVAGAAGRFDEAMALARDADIDVAILDVNLNGNPVYPVADVLIGRGVPFIFSTGYGEQGLPDAYKNCQLLQKPFQLENLEQALAGIANSEA
jgi:CheY-like chemotaxis protein